MDARQVFKDFEGDTIENPVRFCATCGAPVLDAVDGIHSYKVCTACKRPQWRNPAPTVTVMVLKEGSVLLALRAPHMLKGGKWCLPGGFIEWGEDFLTAARREVREETGLEVEIKSILTISSNQHTNEGSTVSIMLLGEPLSGEPAALDETDDVIWHPLSDPLPEMAFEHHVHIIERYLATGLQGVPVDPRYAKPS